MNSSSERTKSADQAHRAEPPRPATLGPAATQAEAARNQYLQGRHKIEQRSVLRGLMLLAVLALLFGFWRADPGRVFFSGWWRHW